MKLFFTIVYIRIISLRWKFDDHPLVEYPLFQNLNVCFKRIVFINYIGREKEQSKKNST